MRTLLGLIFAVAFAILPMRLAQAHDRSGVSFGIIITTDRDGPYESYGRHGRYDRKWRHHDHRHGSRYGRHDGLWGCHLERRWAYHYGRPAELATTVCYDRYGRLVALANSSSVTRSRRHF